MCIGGLIKRDNMECPKCHSEEIETISVNFPKAYECKKCHHIFSEGESFLKSD